MTAEIYLSQQEEQRLIGLMTPDEVQEVLYEASFHKVSTNEWMRSPWAADLRRQLYTREGK